MLPSQQEERRAPWPPCLVLTGFRATGKSVLGRELARRLGYGFLDTDELLCRRLGCAVAEYVALHGWQGFREQERLLLAELAGSRELVIATGGGAILHHPQWQRLRQGAVVVWLQADAETIVRRMATDRATAGQRPSLTGADPATETRALLAERTPLYAAGSDLAVDTVGRPPGALVEEILGRLAERRPRAEATTA
ncbi:MAG TPA: shikimate kinase [Desulfobulbus sp.]|nr:shikimate kinase [Desulfobulbus sp.]